MKSTFKIVGILLLLMFMKAEKCSEQNENADQENLINNIKKEIKSQFDANFLSEVSLVEHEKAAKQKLADFTDYLQILSDSALKQPYREKAGEMIRSLFISDTVLVKIVSGHEMKDHEFSIRQLVQSGLSNELFISRIVYDSVQINQHFSRTGPNYYSAILSFTERKKNSQDGTISGVAFSRKIMAQINKEYKIFASDTLSVWTLHLGKIE